MKILEYIIKLSYFFLNILSLNITKETIKNFKNYSNYGRKDSLIKNLISIVSNEKKLKEDEKKINNIKYSRIKKFRIHFFFPIKYKSIK